MSEKKLFRKRRLIREFRDGHRPGKKRLLVTRFQVSTNVNVNQTSIRQPVSTVQSTENEESVVINDDDTQIYRANLLFVYLDVKIPSNQNLIGPIRSIHDHVKCYSNFSNCLKFLQNSSDKIFFISSLNDKELLQQIHDCLSVEAMFIINSDTQIDRIRFPKVVGIYEHSEELFAALKNALDWFEQAQLDFFTFEREQLFLWLQLWREVKFYFLSFNIRIFDLVR